MCAQNEEKIFDRKKSKKVIALLSRLNNGKEKKIQWEFS